MQSYLYLFLIAIFAAVFLLFFIPTESFAADPNEVIEIVQLPPLIFQAVYCGDGICDETESCVACSTDCGDCPPEEIELGARVWTVMLLAALILYIWIKKNRGKQIKRDPIDWPE